MTVASFEGRKELSHCDVKKKVEIQKVMFELYVCRVTNTPHCIPHTHKSNGKKLCQIEVFPCRVLLFEY